MVAPTASGSSAATALRNTIRLSSKRIGNATSSARRDVLAHLVVDLRRRVGDAAERPRRRGARARCSMKYALALVALAVEVGEQVRRAAVLGDQRAVAAGLVAHDGADAAHLQRRARPRRCARCAAAESAGGQPHERDDARRRRLAGGVEDLLRARSPPRRAGRRSRCRSRARRTPAPPSTAARPPRSTANADQDRAALPEDHSSRSAHAVAHSSWPTISRRSKRGDQVQQHPVREEVPCLVEALRRPARRRCARACRSRRARRPGTAGRRRPRRTASGSAARGGRAAGRSM